MKINCVSCGHGLQLGDAYDDFEGLVKCYVCSQLLQVKISHGKVKSVSLTVACPDVPSTAVRGIKGGRTKVKAVSGRP
ncbi:MAG: hypothetical protein AB1473_03820 [Thermodesulfobacteriota bacterium]